MAEISSNVCCVVKKKKKSLKIDCKVKLILGVTPERQVFAYQYLLSY